MAELDCLSPGEVKSLKQLVGLGPPRRDIPRDHLDKLVRLGWARVEGGAAIPTALGRTEAGRRRG
jgi:hypothetical protein